MFMLFTLFILFSIPIAIVDVRCGRIPDGLSLPAGASLALCRALSGGGSLAEGAAGAALCFGFFWVIRSMTGGLGLGDVKYGLAIGMATGPAYVFFALCFASALALSFALPLAFLGKLSRAEKIPFGPFLAVGTVCALGLKAANIGFG